MIPAKTQPNRKANFEGDYPLTIPRVNSPRFQAELDQWYFDFKTVLMRQRTELYDFVNDEINQLDKAQEDIVVVEEEVEEIQEDVVNINNHLTQIDNSITTINNQIITITHIVNTFAANTATGSGIVQANGTGNPQTAITGSTGHFPYWRPNSPYLSEDSPIYVSAGRIGVGTVGPMTELDVVGVINASTGFRVNNLAVAGTVLRSDGTNYIGGQVVLTTDVTSVLPVVNGGTNASSWTPGSVIFAGAGGTSLAQDNANLFWDDALNRFGVGTNAPNTQVHVTDATKGVITIGRTAAVATLGQAFGALNFYNGLTARAAIIEGVADGFTDSGRLDFWVKPTGGSILQAMVIKSSGNVGVGTNAPAAQVHIQSSVANAAMFELARLDVTKGFRFINYNGTDTAFKWQRSTDLVAWTDFMSWDPNVGDVGIGVSDPLARVHATVNDAVTTVTDVLRLNHSLNTGGTAANFGTGILLTGETSTTDAMDMARIQTIWTDATHATRTSSLQFQTVNSAAALVNQMTLRGDGRLGVGRDVTLTTTGAWSLISAHEGLSSGGVVIITSNIAQNSVIGGFSMSIRPSGTGELSNIRGLNMAVEHRGTHVGSIIRSVYGTARLNTASARANTLIGGSFDALTDGATGGTVGNLTGAEFMVAVQNAGVTASTVYGVRVHNLINTGTITNTYGVWVGDITTGTQTNTAYSFYASDANAWNYFAGRLGLGTTLPAVMLDLGLAGTTLGVMRMAGSTSGNVTIQPAVAAGTWTLTLPVNDGDAGDILTTDGGGVTSWQPPSAASAHDILSATHTDTLAAAVSRGSLIYGNATPLWAELVVDTNNRVLKNNGTDIAWGKVDLAAGTDITGLLALGSGGTNKLMAASAGAVVFSDADSLELTAVGSSGQVLLSQGTGTPIWSSGSPLLQLWEEGVGTDYTPPLDDQYYDVSFGTSGTLELSLTVGTWLVTAVMAWTNPSAFDVYFQYDLGGAAQAGSEQIVIASGPAQTVLQYKVTVGSTTAIKVQIKTPNPAYSNVIVYAATSNISAVRLTA